MSKIKELAEAHKLKVGFVGGAVVVSSIFGPASSSQNFQAQRRP
jgi:hypothetical protein